MIVGVSEDLEIYRGPICEYYRSIEICYCLYEGKESGNIYTHYSDVCGFYLDSYSDEDFTYQKRLFSSEKKILFFE